jgi:hypothetical protein
MLFASSLYADVQKLRQRGIREFVLSYVRLKDAKHALLWITPAALLLAVLGVGCGILDIRVSLFTRDPMAITNGYPLYGFVSNLGAILWSASASFCFFAYMLLRSCLRAGHEIRFFMVGGGISLMLLMDDFFMFHDSIAPVYLGVNEGWIILIYGALSCYYMLAYWELIRVRGFLLFVLSVVFFVLSILIDILPETLLPYHFLYEDGFKFLGITSWCGFHYTVCLYRVRLALPT